MANWYKGFFGGNKPVERIDEQIESFRPNKQRANVKQARQGEGYEDIDFILSGQYNALGFSSFYSNYINKSFQNEIERLKYYREIAHYPEVADVIEDAVMEATQEDMEGRILRMEITSQSLSSNSNAATNLQKEFYDLFYNRIKIKDDIWHLMYNPLS